MLCPYCGAPFRELQVIETSHTKTTTRRRRACGLCNQRCSTVELVVNDSVRVSKPAIVLLDEKTKAALKSALT